MYEITIAGPDGADLTFGPLPSGDAKSARVHVFGVAEIQSFGFCPICGTTEKLTKEHVPQRDLGGTVMTYTCEACNNNLGSRVEDELKHWFDDAILDVEFSGGDVPGKRKMSRILVRTTVDGQVGLFFEGRTDPNLGAMLASGTAEMSGRRPIPRIWLIAALKHAYLAACLTLGEVPSTDHAAAIRGLLITARDGARGELPPKTGLTTGLRIARTGVPATGPTVQLVALVDADGSPLDYGLLLAGTMFVSWPLDAELFWVAVRRFQPERADSEITEPEPT